MISIKPIMMGMWQVSGSHGSIDPQLAIEAMLWHHRSGFTCWDLADIYGPAEDFVLEFRRRVLAELGAAELAKLVFCTKWVPTNFDTRWTLEADYDLKFVESHIDRSLIRMGVEQLDLLQFHWWDYADPRLYDCLRHLFSLKAKGKIKEVGLTNFSGKALEAVLRENFSIFSNQVRFSLVDQRPQHELTDLCVKNNVKILAFGTLAAGFLTETWLGKPEPLEGPFNRGQVVQKGLIKAFGGWAMLQELLTVLKLIADQHQVSIASVATRYILQQPGVGAAIIGARLGVTEHATDNKKTLDLQLETADLKRIEDILARTKNLSTVLGEVACEYRGVDLP